MASMRVVQVAEPNGPLELVEREVPVPATGEALIRVQACGVCHSDSYAKTGGFPGMSHPLVPGHEIAGVIAELGHGVHGLGDRPARRRRLVRRELRLLRAVQARRPDVLPEHGHPRRHPRRRLRRLRGGEGERDGTDPGRAGPQDAAPLLCAGITTYNALRHSGARGGDLVAILGVGGLGHLGVQFAAKLGFDTVAIARGREKEELARRLGARHYIDSTAATRPPSCCASAARRRSSRPSPAPRR